jgi:hypothetical protein
MRGQRRADEDDDYESEDEEESKPPKLMKPAATRRLVTRPKAAATEESVGFKVLETGARGALTKGVKQLQGLDDEEEDKQWGRQQRGECVKLDLRGRLAECGVQGFLVPLMHEYRTDLPCNWLYVMAAPKRPRSATGVRSVTTSTFMSWVYAFMSSGDH